MAVPEENLSIFFTIFGNVAGVFPFARRLHDFRAKESGRRQKVGKYMAFSRIRRDQTENRRAKRRKKSEIRPKVHKERRKITARKFEFAGRKLQLSPCKFPADRFRRKILPRSGAENAAFRSGTKQAFVKIFYKIGRSFVILPETGGNSRQPCMKSGPMRTERAFTAGKAEDSEPCPAFAPISSVAAG